MAAFFRSSFIIISGVACLALSSCGQESASSSLTPAQQQLAHELLEAPEGSILVSESGVSLMDCGLSKVGPPPRISVSRFDDPYRCDNAKDTPDMVRYADDLALQGYHAVQRTAPNYDQVVTAAAIRVFHIKD